MNLHSTSEQGGPQPEAPPEPAFALGSAAEPPATISEELLRRQQAVVAMGRRAIAAPETSILLQDAAALIAEMLDVEFSAVAEVMPDGATMRARLAARQPGGEEPRSVVRELDMSRGQSLAAYALQVAHPLLTDDLSVETRFQDRFLRSLGIRSALAMPLEVQERAFGVLIACSGEPQRFHMEDLLFAEVIGHLASTSAARSEAEQNLAEERALMRQFLQTVEALTLVLDADGRVLRINDACERITGFSQEELRERPIWSALATPVEAELYQAMVARLCQAEPQVTYECSLLTKHGERRWIRWSSSALADAQGTVNTIVVTGIDATEQYLAKQSAQAVQAAQTAPKAANSMPAAVPEGLLSHLAALQKGTPSAAVDGPACPTESSSADRRQQPRRPYSYRQKVAPIVDGKLPSREQFREVQCYDIAAGGIAYLGEERPESDLLVLALGAPPRLTYMIAQVVHVTTITHEGRQVFKIGCKYTGRAPY